MHSHNFENLEVWRRGCRLAVDVFQRSSLSIPSNITEGAERPSDADFCRFLGYSKGSCGELRTQLMIHRDVCRELGLDPFAKTDVMIEETRELSRMIGGLMEKVSGEP